MYKECVKDDYDGGEDAPEDGVEDGLDISERYANRLYPHLIIFIKKHNV